MKALQTKCSEIGLFPPGHVWRSSTGQFERWFQPPWLDLERIPTAKVGRAPAQGWERRGGLHG